MQCADYYKMHIIEGLEKATGKNIDPDHTELKTLGLNHLSWHRGFTDRW